MIVATHGGVSEQMITYPRGTIRSPSADGVVDVQTASGPAIFEILLDPGPIAPGDAVVAASNTIQVGVVDIEALALLGPRPLGSPDPAGPLGLAATPVVVLSDPRWSGLTVAGITRAGRSPVTAVVDSSMPALGLRMLEAVTDGAEVVVIEGGAGPQLSAARLLGGRPLAALPEPADVVDYFTGCRYDVHVPVPGVVEPLRSRIAGALRPLELEDRHHLVEVDPTPAFDEAGVTVDGAPVDALTAAAAGVLAGRLAVGNRRWRAYARD
jgi:hypothetical protein